MPLVDAILLGAKKMSGIGSGVTKYMYFGPKEKNTYKTNFKFSYVSVLDSLQLQSLLQPRVSLPAIDINGRRVWLFYNAIGAVA